MDKTRGWVLILGVLLIVAWVGFSVVSATQKALSPVNQITWDLGTSIAQVLNPTPTILPDPVTIIHDIRSLARLETIQYSLEKVIVAENNQGPLGFLFGDKLLFVAHGDVIAGIDLAKLNPEDMWVKGDVLYVTLPAAEIFIAALDNDKSYVYDRETGVLTHGDMNLETSARQAAEAEILLAALEDGILEQGRLNAENYLIRLLRNLGYPEVIFVEATPVPSPAP